MFAPLQRKHLDVAGKLDYHCGSASGKVSFRYTAFRQCPRYREKTEERVIHYLPLGELVQVALRVHVVT